jgi:tetratricopeptide (TPR) repeat protein
MISSKNRSAADGNDRRRREDESDSNSAPSRSSASSASSDSRSSTETSYSENTWSSESRSSSRITSAIEEASEESGSSGDQSRGRDSRKIEKDEKYRKRRSSLTSGSMSNSKESESNSSSSPSESSGSSSSTSESFNSSSNQSEASDSSSSPSESSYSHLDEQLPDTKKQADPFFANAKPIKNDEEITPFQTDVLGTQQKVSPTASILLGLDSHDSSLNVSGSTSDSASDSSSSQHPSDSSYSQLKDDLPQPEMIGSHFENILPQVDLPRHSINFRTDLSESDDSKSGEYLPPTRRLKANQGGLERVLSNDQGHLAGVRLRHPQSPTTTVSSLSTSMLASGALPPSGAKLNASVGTTLDMLEVSLADTRNSILISAGRKPVRQLVAMRDDDDELDNVRGESIHSTSHTSHHLLQGFDALLGALLELSDELEMAGATGDISIDGRSTVLNVGAILAVLGHAPTVDLTFSSLKPILQRYLLENEPDDEMDHLLERALKLVRLLCEITFRVYQRQEWNNQTETSYVTLLELLERTTLEITCASQDNDQPVPGYQMSGNLRRAWTATGHIEELKTLFVTNDMWLVRQLCYEVLISTGQWCPNICQLGLVCDVSNSLAEDEDGNLSSTRLAPTPPAALLVLDRINGKPLPRAPVMAYILRCVLPPYAVIDSTVLDNLLSTRSFIRNRAGLSIKNTNTVVISSAAEDLSDPLSMGMAGVGKSTMAAIVVAHTDVRRFFKDGIAWLHLGREELDYQRYTQCLRELLSQLVFYKGGPVLFPELLHTPGEPSWTRKRREEGFMTYARDLVTDLMLQRTVLIVLDDVYFESDVAWFNFVSQVQIPEPSRLSKTRRERFSPSVMVTTNVRHLLPTADRVEIDLLDEADAIKLLVTESGQPSEHVIASSKEAQQVVRECANHPLAVKSVGRWLSLKHATAGVINSVEEVHEGVDKSFEKILNAAEEQEVDFLFEILGMSFCPVVYGQPTNIIKFCFAAFVQVFCSEREFTSQIISPATPSMVPWTTAVLLFDTLLKMEEETLFPEDSPFYSQRNDISMLIPEALSALGVLKHITTYKVSDDDSRDDSTRGNLRSEEIFLQISHDIQHEYGEYLFSEEKGMKGLTHNAECSWNRAFAEAYMSQAQDWGDDSELPVEAREYALDHLVSHMLRAEMWSEATKLLADKNFVRGRICALGIEKASRRHIKDCEIFYSVAPPKIAAIKVLPSPGTSMVRAYNAFGAVVTTEATGISTEVESMHAMESGRAHYEMGFSLAEKRLLPEAISHMERSKELLLSCLGIVEFVAAIEYNIGVVFAEMSEYEQSLASLQQCLHIRGAIHGETHILYAQTIKKIGDVFFQMSDYSEAMESYDSAMDIMHFEPSSHRIDIGEILDNLGNIHYIKGEVPEALLCYQDALTSKKFELGDNHPELALIYQHIGNCLAEQGDIEQAIAHVEQAIRLKELDPDMGPERDADLLSIEGILNNLTGREQEGLHCYEKALDILVTKLPFRKEKIAVVMNLIGCAHLLNGESKKALRFFVESIQARRDVLGYVHLDVAGTLFNMAFVHQSHDRPKRALRCLEEALKIRQLRLPDSEKVVLTHEKIGTLAKAIGKSRKAEKSFEEALRIRRLIHGDEHEAVAAILHEIGDLMDDLGMYDEAMYNYSEALFIRRKRLGRHEDVAATLCSIAFTFHNQDQPKHALRYFEAALEMRKVCLGVDATEVGDTLNMMGFLHAKLGELDDALALLLDALRIRKIQKEDMKISETLKNIGNVHREKQEYDLAVELYQECLRIRRQGLGDDHEKVADALIALGNVHGEMEQIDDAIREYQEALKIRTLAHGENDESVAVVLQYMGTMEFRCGDLDRARSYLDEFVRIRHHNDALDDVDYINVMFVIGNIHMIQGDENAANRYWSDAYHVVQELGLERVNPHIAGVMDRLLRHRRLEVPQKRPQHEDRPMTKPLTSGLLGRIAASLKDTLREER